MAAKYWNMIVCSKCYEENDDDARFCDNCGAALWKDSPEADLADSGEACCPECGGKVKAVKPGEGVCTQCGAQLVGKEEPPAAEPKTAPAEDSPAQELSRLIQEKLHAGMALEQAVDSSCAEFLPGTPPAAAPAEDQPALAAARDCPVCGQGNPKDATRCGGCGIVFKRTGEPIPCPRCSLPCYNERCSCGAFLTLSKLLEYVEPSVRFVCPRCRQMFTTDTDQCSDCGAGVVPAARLKDYAAQRNA